MHKIIDEFKMLLSPEEKNARLDICRACEHMEMRLGQEVCRECLCVLTFKTRVKPAKCPIGKW
jgi:hypothetical protein